jgi:hypothetical protein
MNNHKTGTREEWLAARLELLKAEKELTRRGDELTQRRQELPWVRIEKEYRFETDEGRASLADLFRGRSQLLIYHFMFGPDYKAGCATCSTIADGFNGFAVHLANHDVIWLCHGRRSRSCRHISGGWGEASRGLPRSAPISTPTSTSPLPRRSNSAREASNTTIGASPRATCRGILSPTTQPWPEPTWLLTFARGRA